MILSCPIGILADLTILSKPSTLNALIKQEYKKCSAPGDDGSSGLSLSLIQTHLLYPKFEMVSSFADDGPSFYTLRHCRRIPAGFKGIIGERFPCVIYLKVLYGPWFKVVVYKDKSGKMAMQEERMKDFMLANKISLSNFLIFHCEGNLNFNVQVFNPSGLERVPENQEQYEAFATSNGQRKRGEPKKYGKEDHKAKLQRGHQDSERKPSKKIPAFFKAFVTQDAQQRLNIPLVFAEYIEGMISFTAFLRNRKSYVWTVETTKNRNQYSFDNGWPEFVEENDVQLGDFLVFQYDGKCTFDFKHFGSSMCEKEAKISKFKVEEEYEGLDEDDDDVVVVEEKDVNEEVYKKVSVNDHGNNEENAIFVSGLVERPKNPYFVARIHPSHRSYLHVPSDVIKQFNLKLPEYLYLFVKHERGWKTKVNVWKDGRILLSKGWREFCKCNNVQLDDRCICEFVQRNGSRDIFLQISIVRAGSW